VAGAKEAEENKALPGGATRATDTRPTVGVGGGADVPDIPEVGSARSGAALPRQHARHAVVGVEAQDVVEVGTRVAKRRDVVDVGLIDLSDRKGTWALEEMERCAGCDAG